LSVDSLADRWERAWSGRDPAAFVKVCAGDLHYEDPLTEEPLEGPAALGAHASWLWEVFPDARLERTGPRPAEGRHAVFPCKLVATHRGEVAGMPPSGRFVVVHVVFYVELDAAGRRLWRVRGFFDLYDAAVQIGLMPRRGSLTQKALLMLRGFGLRGAAGGTSPVRTRSPRP
jgi:steroid delta-isomerase-like uncharacterized protein